MGRQTPGGSVPHRRATEIVVLETTRPPDGTTRYVDQVVTYADPRFRFVYLSIRVLAGQRFDIFHVHWPEVLVRGRTALETAVRSGMLRLLIRTLRIRRVPIVRTLHNLEPHEPGSDTERRALRALDDATTSFVALNPLTIPPHGSAVHIPHGHYRDRLTGQAGIQPERGRLLYIGRVEPYKKVDRLIETFPRIGLPGLTLRIVGKPTPALRAVIEAAAQRERRITTKLGWVTDEELAAEVAAAELVCLPYTDLHNSGILLVALSLDRPVLVPDTPTTRRMAQEVGGNWVQLFEGELEPDHVAAALHAVRERAPQERPMLDGRDWQVVAAGYARVFDDALRSTGRRQDPGQEGGT